MRNSGTVWRYVLVGASVAGLYVVLYLMFLAISMPQLIANGLAFLMAVAFQYVAQARFTFAAPLNDTAQITRFVTMIGLGLITSAIVTGLIGPAIGLPNWLAAALVTVILPVQNYVIMTRWVFSDPSEQMETQQ